MGRINTPLFEFSPNINPSPKAKADGSTKVNFYFSDADYSLTTQNILLEGSVSQNFDLGSHFYFMP